MSQVVRKPSPIPEFPGIYQLPLSRRPVSRTVMLWVSLGVPNSAQMGMFRYVVSGTSPPRVMVGNTCGYRDSSTLHTDGNTLPPAARRG